MESLSIFLQIHPNNLKELLKKTNYIKELEDVIEENEFKISELENVSDEIANVICQSDVGADQLKNLEEKCKLESKLKEKLSLKVSENIS